MPESRTVYLVKTNKDGLSKIYLVENLTKFDE